MTANWIYEVVNQTPLSISIQARREKLAGYAVCQDSFPEKRMDSKSFRQIVEAQFAKEHSSAG